MKTTYTIRSKMPLPTTSVHATSSILIYYKNPHCLVQIDTSKTKAWLDAVTSLLNHPSVLFASMIEGEFQISLTDKNVADEFHAKWGAE
ncbi:MAG: hypothetical protein DI606_16365 [Sphingobium sp.]|uniref:hypothetical protein n=1 Tax=Sphingobium sp. TaxID=1912891 RepID=UPI000DB36B47|nr:hypothetical protein [Sphingobium sp.]PZU07655.1 MAG: hypothetical protein DI606_16365 [Sphingobium sp.]